MSRTRTSLLGVLALALVVPLAPPAAAAPPVCGAGPVELVGGGHEELLAGQEHVQAYVLRRRLGGGRTCVVPGATVQLLARNAGATTQSVARTGTTDEDGRVQFRVRPPFTVLLSGRTLAGGGFSAVASARTELTVATRLSLARRALGGCREAVSGRTYPAKPETPVEVLRERPREEPLRVGRFLVRADGTWSGAVRVPCGTSPRLVATIQQTARNAPGSSDRRIELASRTRECGTAPTSSGETGTALTHAFEAFNLTTAVGGSWWGERVVSNRTDRVLAFRSYSTDFHRLLRRGSTVVVGTNGFNDAILVREHRLAPGEELREEVALPAANCLAEPEPGVGYFALPTGPAFPAGTAVAGVTVLAMEGGTSVSNRVPLTVS